MVVAEIKAVTVLLQNKDYNTDFKYSHTLNHVATQSKVTKQWQYVDQNHKVNKYTEI